MLYTNNIDVTNALNNLLAALKDTPVPIAFASNPKAPIDKMTARQRRDRFRPLIERKFHLKYPFP